MKPKIASKIINRHQAKQLLESVRNSGKTVGLCHGVFDLLHPGHLEHIAEAAKECDLLVVSITADKYVNKGPGRPYFNEELRSMSLASLEAVDAVLVTDSYDALKVIDLVSPDFYFKGPDYVNEEDDITGMIKAERNAVEDKGGKVILTKGFTSSSSRLINREFSPLGNEVQSWIDNLREKYSFTHFQQEIRKIEELRVLVIGEIIVDEYTHVEALGKVNKDPILAFDKLGNSTFLGGAFAVAKNIACWSKHVTLVSYVGSNWSNYESLMLDSSKIELKLIHENNRPTIRKHRYISNSDNRKLFEYYDFSEEIISEESRNQIEDFLEENLFKYDLVLVCDYGHGLIDEKLANYLSNLSTFLAVNVQQNAGNRGFNSIEKYSNVDFFTLNINEMQWTIKSKSFQREFAIEELMHKLKSSAAILTLGPEGLLAFKTDQSLLSAWVPAFSTKIVDKVGAGDAIYAMSALLICTSSPLEIAGLASSLIAADEISKFGHTNPLTIKSLLKQVKSILA